ncbi:uncharacterized protein BO88DRAFT_142648 [Aspergillus vadensis CBS 113365]|uniref:Uncharacterized protein n=1 Tax=Aspergillus vadensis (strain CBS 113365 / IMI 142717 / IBT 24658) TaxID=1448311 RepID=A0A319BIB5_ASPVC|nr:hypothetical protein BO88DRAFT_142648 [Aspergillus vadensis CBS 113365]PYH65533.1 hypothetical protein BO88DRAFT_142648 [Aspergillus vadensis CBS 113365]
MNIWSSIIIAALINIVRLIIRFNSSTKRCQLYLGVKKWYKKAVSPSAALLGLQGCDANKHRVRI